MTGSERSGEGEGKEKLLEWKDGGLSKEIGVEEMMA